MLSGKYFHSELAQLFFTILMYHTKVASPLTDTFCQRTLPISCLPMVPCGLSPVARLYLAKNEAPEEEAVP